MRIDGHELVVVVLVGTQVARIAAAAVGITRVVHTGAEIPVVEILVLMIEAEGVADFLTDNELPPGRSVVRGRGKVRVVHPDRALRDVAAAHPNLGDAEPSVVAVSTVADLVTA